MLTVVFYGALIFLCIILLLVLCIVKDEPSCKITWYIICIVMIVFIELTDYVFIFYNWTLSGSPRLSPTFIYLLIIYNFLPFSHPYVTVAADLLVTVIDLFFSGFVFYEQLAQHFGKGYRVELVRTCNQMNNDIFHYDDYFIYPCSSRLM